MPDLKNTLKLVVAMTKATIENSTEYALTLVKEGNYEEAKVYLVNALEGIEILSAE